MREKRWNIFVLSITFICLLVIAVSIIIVDPYFHYHKPLPDMAYILQNEYYINNGIIKHFNYDAVITGSSMTENFKTSEFDQSYGVNSIKVPLSGASYKEVD